MTVAAASAELAERRPDALGDRLIGLVAVHSHRCSGCEAAMLAVTSAAQRGVQATLSPHLIVAAAQLRHRRIGT